MDAQSTELCDNLKLNGVFFCVSFCFRHGRFVMKAFFIKPDPNLCNSVRWCAVCRAREVRGCPLSCGQSATEFGVCVYRRQEPACSQKPGTARIGGVLVHLKVIKAHSENHQLNCVHLVLPVRRFAEDLIPQLYIANSKLLTEKPLTSHFPQMVHIPKGT